MTTIEIRNPSDSDHCINVVYIGLAKPGGAQPALNDRQLISGSATIRPGETMPVNMYKGYGSVSIHEGQPVVRLLPSKPNQP